MERQSCLVQGCFATFGSSFSSFCLSRRRASLASGWSFSVSVKTASARTDWRTENSDDLHSMFPAEAARTMGLADIPLMCARELAITGGMPRCVRVMAQVESAHARAAVEHIYHGEARSLRPDISPSSQ